MSTTNATSNDPPRDSVVPSKSSSTSSKNRSPQRPSTSSEMAGNGVDRTKLAKTIPGSASAARATARRNSTRDGRSQGEDDARAENSALVEELKEQVRKTEQASEEYQKQLHVVQSRLDDALAGQSDLEESMNRHTDTVTGLETQLHDAQRLKDDLQTKVEIEHNASNRERDNAAARETELTDIIARLKDSLSQRESRPSLSGDGSLPPTASFRGRSSPNPESTRVAPALQRRDSSQHSVLVVLQKDKVIEDLRLELAEAHLKVMEVDRAGGGRLNEMEKQLLEARMSNAKLMEDNESFQYLLQEKTLSGDMASKFRSMMPAEQDTSRAPSRDAGGNLADELETVGEDEEVTDMDRKRLERELAAQKDENRALSLYINRIIGKLLITENFEQLFENGTITANTPLNASTTHSDLGKAQMDKELPQAPDGDPDMPTENAGSSLLARAGSIFGGRSKARPKSYQPPLAADVTPLPTPTTMSFNTEPPTRLSMDHARPLAAAVEDPGLAPRVPLTRGGSARYSSNPRGHRRTTSEISTGSTGGLYTSRAPTGALSPPMPASKRSSMQAAPGESMLEPSIEVPAPTSAPSLSLAPGPDMSDIRSVASATPSDSGHGDSITTPSSPPRSVAASSTDGARATGGAATVSGKQMRPLRLVQEKAEFDAERKKQHRGSWMGWLTKGPQPGVSSGSQLGQTRPGSQDER